MSLDPLQEFVRVRNRLFDERRSVLGRLSTLDEILEGFARGQTPSRRGRKPKYLVEAEAAGTIPRRVKKQPLKLSDLPPRMEINSAASDFPVAMFPFPERAFTAFSRGQIQKLGQLNGRATEDMGFGKNMGTKTLEEVISLVGRINQGDLFFPTDQPVPIQQFACLVDQGLSEFDEAALKVVLHRFGAHGNETQTLENLGQELGISRERVRQMETECIARLTRIHGAKIFQIGKVLGGLSKARLLDFKDISEEANPPKWAPEFYLAVLKQMFPGLKIGAVEAVSVPAAAAVELESPDALRSKIFG